MNDKISFEIRHQDNTTYSGPLDFAFIVHARDASDIVRMYPGFAGLQEEEAFKALSMHSLHICSQMDVSFDHSFLHGELIGIPFNPNHYRQELRSVRQALSETLAYCSQRRARIVGLGALLPSMTRLGEALLTHSDSVGVTTGHCFTAHAIAEHVRKIEWLVGSPAKVGIVGAAGSTGQSAFQSLIADETPRSFTLIDLPPRLSIIQKITAEYPRPIHVSSDLSDLRECSVVICVTNATTAIIPSEVLAPNAIIVDDAQPENVSYETLLQRPDVTVIKCLAQVPGLSCPFDFGLFPATEFASKQSIVFTCLAETVALAGSGHVGHFSIGIPTISRVNEIARIAEGMGITIAPFHSFPQIGEISDKVLKERSKNCEKSFNREALPSH